MAMGRRGIAIAVKKDFAVWLRHLPRHECSLAIPSRNHWTGQSGLSSANVLQGHIPRRMLSEQARRMQPALMLDAEMARARAHWRSVV